MSEAAKLEKTAREERWATTYAKQGYLVVRQLYPPAEMVSWKQHIQDAMRDDGSLNDPSGVRVWKAGAIDSGLAAWMTEPKVVQVLRTLIGPKIEFLSVKAVFKNAAHAFGSPWHQDWFYWEGAPKLSVWLALDDATPANGCLKMIPGSHHQIHRMVRADDGLGFARRVEDDAIRGRSVDSIEVARGDAVFFHDLTLHSSYPNTSGADRWSLISTYRDASVPDSSTTWSASVICD